jgi:hypothetical protein
MQDGHTSSCKYFGPVRAAANTGFGQFSRPPRRVGAPAIFLLLPRLLPIRFHNEEFCDFWLSPLEPPKLQNLGLRSTDYTLVQTGQ